jgi:hypothetical protein
VIALLNRSPHSLLTCWGWCILYVDLTDVSIYTGLAAGDRPAELFTLPGLFSHARDGVDWDLLPHIHRAGAW